MENRPQKTEEPGHKLLPPKMFRRLERTRKHGGVKYNNIRNTIGSNRFAIGFGKVWNPQAIYSPPNKRFKGWQRENRRYKKRA